jgi:hypothetical protein
VRRTRQDGILGNYLVDGGTIAAPSQIAEPADQSRLEQTEDCIKKSLAIYLATQGWTVRCVAWGKNPGVDMEAEFNGQRWLIEVKGIGSRPQMRANYFLAVLGELVFRMNDAAAKYSIALPDVPQFRRLWSRVPAEAKARLRITALFVTKTSVLECQ